MGFIYGSETGSRVPAQKTFNDVVGDVMRANGVPAPSTVTSGSNKHTLVAASSVNRAMSRVWNAAMWDWRVVWINFQLDNEAMFYDLPLDYELFCTAPTNAEWNFSLPFITYEDIVKVYPGLESTPSATTSEIALEYLQARNEKFEEQGYFGKPSQWGIRGSKIFFFRIPASGKYADAAEWDAERQFIMSYFGAYKEMTADDDLLLVPPALVDIVFFIANAYFKQAFEFPDFSADEQRGEGLLRLAVNRGRSRFPDSAYSRFRTPMDVRGPYYGS